MGILDFLNPLKNRFGFDVDQHIPDLSSRVIIVTGGNAGVGKESILQFAKHNPKKLYLCARSQQKFDTAAAEIREKVPDAKLDFLQLDLASFASVKQAAEKVLAENDRLDILMNNAGIMCAPHGLTTEGYEIHFGTNHMGHALFTRLLLPLLESTANQPGSDVRIVIVSSIGHTMASSGIPFEELKSEGSSKHPLRLYGVSKLANNLHARKLARLHPKILTVAAHPGRTDTSLAQDFKNEGSFSSKLVGLFDRLVTPLPAEQGALSQLWAATWQKKDIENGNYYVPVGCSEGASAKSKDEELASSLWDWQEAEFKRLGY